MDGRIASSPRVGAYDFSGLDSIMRRNSLRFRRMKAIAHHSFGCRGGGSNLDPAFATLPRAPSILSVLSEVRADIP